MIKSGSLPDRPAAFFRERSRRAGVLSGGRPSCGSRTRIPRCSEAAEPALIALRHQIAVLERSGTRRPCFHRWDRLFWILFSRWWPQWRDSLIIVQAETVLRWRRDGWSALWRYQARRRWRGGRPRVSNEVRHLIAQMAHENFPSLRGLPPPQARGCLSLRAPFLTGMSISRRIFSSGAGV